MLTPKHSELFDIPFYQFSQLKKYQPESIPQIKADYKAAWQDWQALIRQVAEDLGAPFAPPHIERWCNGWQVRAHFSPISNTRNTAMQRRFCRCCSTAAA